MDLTLDPVAVVSGTPGRRHARFDGRTALATLPVIH